MGKKRKWKQTDPPENDKGSGLFALPANKALAQSNNSDDANTPHEGNEL